MNSRPFLKLPVYLLGGWVVLYLAITLMGMGSVPTWHWTQVRLDVLGARCLLLVIGCVGCGIVRVMLLHPRYAPKYGNWLMGTPWRPGMNLPLGPVHLVWEDLLYALPLAALSAMDVGASPWLPVMLYLLGYTCAAVGTVRDDKTVWYTLWLALVWSLVLPARHENFAMAGILLALIIFSRLTIVHSLRKFPWDLGDPMRETRRLSRVSLAWPLNRVGPVAEVKSIDLLTGWTIAAMIAWWTYSLLQLLASITNEVLIPAVAQEIPTFLAYLALLRLCRFIIPYWPPISILGRIVSGRLIIPGYDYIFINPIAACGVAYTLPRLLEHLLPIEMSTALSVFVVAGIAINTGPTLRHWQLTGHHRMVPLARREPVVPKLQNTSFVGS